MLVQEIEKEPFDEFGYAIQYHQVLGPGEKLSSSSLAAIRQSDGVDISASFLASASATIPSGTATGGSKTTIIAGSDLVAAGFRAGDFVINETKGFMAKIKDIRFTTTKNDTLVFDEQAVASANLDVFSAAKAVASLKAGADGNRVKVIFSTTTSFANKYQDEVLVNVKDY